MDFYCDTPIVPFLPTAIVGEFHDVAEEKVWPPLPGDAGPGAKPARVAKHPATSGPSPQPTEYIGNDNTKDANNIRLSST